MTTTNTTPPADRPRPGLSLAARLALAGAAAAAAVTGIALAIAATSASAATRTATSGHSSPDSWSSWGNASPQGAWPGSGTGTGWSSTAMQTGWPGSGPATRWPGSGPGDWAPGSSPSAEYFHVESTSQAGPGAIIVTGVINAGGIEHPGRAIDNATFSDGSFRIDHSSGHPTVRFSTTTCIGTITQSGPFRVYDGTGRFSQLNGSGRYQFAATYATGRGASGCTKTVTAYIQTINGVIPSTA
jgi:hypothetical protein